MDPKNTNSQSTGGANGGRQALFTPLPEVDEDGKPISKPAASSPNPISSHPYFSNQPAETGDIIIGGDEAKPKQNKRPFIIGGIIFAVFAIVATTVMIIAQSGSSKQRINTEVAEQSFNRYANYLLYGKNSSDNLEGAYDRGDVYELEEQLEDSSDEYWETVTDLLSSAISAFNTDVVSKSNSDNESDIQAITDILEKDQSTFAFAQDYAKSKEISDEDIISRYLSSGLDGAKQYINNAYSPIYKSKSEDSQYFATILNAKYNALLQMLELYRTGSCFRGEEIDDACVERIASHSDLESLSATFSAAEENIDSFLEGSISRLEVNCWMVAKAIKGIGSTK